MGSNQLVRGRSKADLLVISALVALTLSVFALYVRCLGGQSLSFEEGLSVVFASRPLPQLLRTLIYEDLHPPLHYLLLHFWMALAGSSEWAVRMPSVLATLLLMPLSLAIVREIWSADIDFRLQRDSSLADPAEAGRSSRAGRSASKAWHVVGIGAAGLIGVSPFLAYYAQETRMYSLAAALALATTAAFLRAVRTAASRWWLWFSLLLTASLYTHYFAAFVVPAFALYALLLDRQWLRRTVRYTLLAGVLYIPWIVPAYMQLGRLLRTPDYWVTTRINPALFVRDMWNAFLPSAPARFGLLAALLGVLVLFRLARRGGLYLSDSVRRAALVFLTSASPLALTYAAVSIAPKFVTRYAIIAAAPFLVCATLAVYVLLGLKSLLTRGAFAMVVLLAIAISLQSTVAITTGRENPRDDARGVAAYLSANAQATDVLLLMENAPYALQYYYRGSAPWYGLHVGQDVASAAATLNRLLQTRPERIWLVLWRHEFADPMDVVVTELLRVGREVDIAQRFPGYGLRAFDIERYDRPIVAYPEPQTATDAEFRAGLRCLGFDRFGNDGWLHYVLYWQAQQSLERNYLLTLDVEDRDGNEYLRHDQALSTPYFLPPVWPVQTPIRGRVDLLLPADLPPVTYRVYLRVLDPQSQRNLDLMDAQGNPLGQALLLEELALSKAVLATAPVSVTNPLPVEMGDHLQLLGYDLPRTAYSHGDTLRLTLWWQSTDRPTQDHQARFRLLDDNGTVAWEAQQSIVPGYPTARWQAGEINRAVYGLSIPSHVPGGKYSLQAGTENGQIALTAVEIVTREHRYDVPPMQQPVEVQFESGIVLLGYDLQAPAIQPGGTITVTLYWQTKQPITTNCKVSVQMLTTGPRMVAQDDSVPAHWTRPTIAWLPNEIIADEHVLSIPAEAEPGSYTLIAALYQEANAQRLRVEQGGQTPNRGYGVPRDHVILTTVRIEP